MMIRPTRAQRGFTFLEIMFVVVIIGVLLAIAVPKLTGQSQKARIKATEAQIRNVGVALKMYEMHVGAFPTTNQGLEALIEKPNDVDEEMWDGPYLDEKPSDAWKRPLNYTSPGDNHTDYDLWSNGPDGKEGTEDDIKNWKDD
ncbi:MAG: ral secretion pathway protein [Candidatus Sumerlaeota bacterium]|nr:ral secretion pathway protein [Candidatus Sumerlaeota bacterium]